MRWIYFLVATVIVGTIAWQIGGRLSPDAVGMAIGVLFGMLAGLPISLLVLASDRRRARDDVPARPPTGLIIRLPADPPRWQVIDDPVRAEMEKRIK